MRGPRTGWLLAALTVAVLAVAVGAHALGGLTGSTEAGKAHYVEVVQTDSSGVIAGLVTETQRTGPLGLTSQQAPVPTGWVVAHPEGTEVAGEVHVVDEIPFEDPNGGTWTEREVRVGNTTAWVVPVDQARHDPTLDAAYNFALVVDWDEVPEDRDLTTSYVDELGLVE